MAGDAFALLDPFDAFAYEEGEAVLDCLAEVFGWGGGFGSAEVEWCEGEG